MQAKASPLGGVIQQHLPPPLSPAGWSSNPWARSAPIHDSSSESLQVSVGAARDIQQGEEIAISCKPPVRCNPISLRLRLRKVPPGARPHSGPDLGGAQAEAEAVMGLRVQVRPLHRQRGRDRRVERPPAATRDAPPRRGPGCSRPRSCSRCTASSTRTWRASILTLGDMEHAEKYAALSLDTLAQKGCIQGGIRPEDLERMWKRFRDGEGGRY
ncbi:hypothetical protein VTK56DRAFT_9749 [Thermocarpiscus australiensis]